MYRVQIAGYAGACIMAKPYYVTIAHRYLGPLPHIALFAYVHVSPEPPGWHCPPKSLRPNDSVTSKEVHVVRKVVVGLLGASLVSSVGIMLPAVASAARPVDPAPAAKAGSNPSPIDDLPNPLEDKRRALREQAVADVVSGEAKPVTRNGSTVVKVGR